MKAILISVQPEYVYKILNKEKILEIRKSIPKCELPCKVYIYCTKDNSYKLLQDNETGQYFKGITSGNDTIHPSNTEYGMNCEYEIQCCTRLNGKVVAEFTLNRVEEFSVGSLRSDDIEKLACLSYKQMIDYFYKPEELDGRHSKQGYAWHIDNLIIYDTPKELSDFSAFIPNNKCEENCQRCDCYNKEHETCLACYNLKKPLTRAPQSWCYIKELEG